MSEEAIESQEEAQIEAPPAEPAAEPVPAEAPPAEGDAPPAEAPPAEGDVPPAAAYTPNYTYKAYGEEKEFDEWVKPLIVNPEAEEKFRTLYAKSGGFDGLKTKYDKLNDDHQALNTQLEEQYQPIIHQLQQLRRSAEIKDYDSFFKQIGVSKQDVLGWAVDQARYSQMSPEEKQAYDRNLSIQRENSRLQTENQTLASQYENQAVEQRARELDLVLSSPEINQVMQDFDRTRGKVGAFRDEVIAYASGKFYSSKQDVSAKDAVDSVLALMGKAPGQAQTPPALATSRPTVIPPQAAKPVIPSMASRNTSPVGEKKPTSIEALKKYAEEFIANG